MFGFWSCSKGFGVPPNLSPYFCPPLCVHVCMCGCASASVCEYAHMHPPPPSTTHARAYLLCQLLQAELFRPAKCPEGGAAHVGGQVAQHMLAQPLIQVAQGGLGWGGVGGQVMRTCLRVGRQQARLAASPAGRAAPPPQPPLNPTQPQINPTPFLAEPSPGRALTWTCYAALAPGPNPRRSVRP